MESNENETSTGQRLLIGAATLIVIVLTVGAAVYLAVIQQPEPPVTVVTVTPALPIVTSTPSATFTQPAAPDTATPTSTASPDQVEPTAEPTEEITPEPSPTETATTTSTATATATSTTAPPTATPPAQVVVQVTAPPAPSTATPDPCRPAGWLEYIVQSGDTLDRLASRINVNQFEIARGNCLSPSAVLQTGQVIVLPSLPGVATPTNTRTPLPTPTLVPAATSTPIQPIIDEVDAQAVNTADPDTKNVVVVVLGRNFDPRTSTFTAVLLGPTRIELEVDRNRSNSTSFQAEREVPAEAVEGLPAGAYDLVVTNPDGRSDTARGVFPRGTPTPIPPQPAIFSVSPTAGRRSENVFLTITGQNFIPRDVRVELQRSTGGSRIALEVDESVSTSTSLRALIRANQLPATGFYDLLVINRDNQVDIENEAYEAIN